MPRSLLHIWCAAQGRAGAKNVNNCWTEFKLEKKVTVRKVEPCLPGRSMSCWGGGLRRGPSRLSKWPPSQDRERGRLWG